MGIPEDFYTYRSKMNEKIIAFDRPIVKQIFNLDTKAFKYWEAPHHVQA